MFSLGGHSLRRHDAKYQYGLKRVVEFTGFGAAVLRRLAQA